MKFSLTIFTPDYGKVLQGNFDIDEQLIGLMPSRLECVNYIESAIGTKALPMIMDYVDATRASLPLTLPTPSRLDLYPNKFEIRNSAGTLLGMSAVPVDPTEADSFPQ